MPNSDDQIVNTQAMLGLPVHEEARLRDETQVLGRTKLNYMSEMIEEIKKCQRTWRYLEPIFASEDIHKQMPTEGNLVQRRGHPLEGHYGGHCH